MALKNWRIETRVTVLRVRYVKAENQKDAEAKSIEAPIDHEEDENEETMSITEIEA